MYGYLLSSRIHLHFANCKSIVIHGSKTAAVIKYPQVTPSLLRVLYFCNIDHSMHLSHKCVLGPLVLFVLSILLKFQSVCVNMKIQYLCSVVVRSSSESAGNPLCSSLKSEIEIFDHMLLGFSILSSLIFHCIV